MCYKLGAIRQNCKISFMRNYRNKCHEVWHYTELLKHYLCEPNRRREVCNYVKPAERSLYATGGRICRKTEYYREVMRVLASFKSPLGAYDPVVLHRLTAL